MSRSILPRRQFLKFGAGALAAPYLSLLPGCVSLQGIGATPFSLGVASGEPASDGMVLWTRLALDPLNGGGMGAADLAVDWEIARDEKFADIAQRGTAKAEATFAHSVHVEVAGLDPDRWYFYRFRHRDALSAVGRTRTAPPAAADNEKLRVILASCQDYQRGYYAAWRHAARENPDLVTFAGDYIYEYAPTPTSLRKHTGGLCQTLGDYRNRYALYKSEAELQEAHAACPWIVTWDDHEVDNDYAGLISNKLDPTEIFRARRAAAYQAYWEHMPLRRVALANNGAAQMYRRINFGRLAEFNVLDDRQYRSQQPCPRPGRGGSNVVAEKSCPALKDPKATLLGEAQEKWLLQGLQGSRARWKLLTQQTLMASSSGLSPEGRMFWTDGWDGYQAQRSRILNFVRQQRVRNLVVTGGDIHMHVVADLRVDPTNLRLPVIASEICGTSISSSGLGEAQVKQIADANPQLKFIDARKRGYVRLDIDRQSLRADLMGVDDATKPTSGISTMARFVVEDGRPGPQRVAGPAA